MGESKHDYKGYYLGALGTFAMVAITSKGQGPVPEPLRGMFTSYASAERAVDSYLDSLLKGKKNGKATKAKSTSTG